MDRRRAVVGTASALSGFIGSCLYSLDAGTIRINDDGEFPDLSVTGDEIPEGHVSGLSASVELTRQYSEDEPTRLGISVTNRSDAPRHVTFGPSPPFSSYRGEQKAGSALAILVPDDRTHVHVGRVDDADGEPEDPVDGCWQVGGLGWNDVARLETLDPGESLTGTYSVFASTENEDCLPTGEYRFEEHWVNEPDSSPGFSVDWGFTLSVEA